MYKAQFIDRMWLRIKGLATLLRVAFLTARAAIMILLEKVIMHLDTHSTKIGYFPSYESFSQGYSFQAFHVSF